MNPNDALAAVACPQCKAPCTRSVNAPSGEWGWGTTDEQRAEYAYTHPQSALSAEELNAVESMEKHFRDHHSARLVCNALRRHTSAAKPVESKTTLPGQSVFDRSADLDLIANTTPAGVQVDDAVAALPALWRKRADRKEQCGLKWEAELDRCHATELDAALAHKAGE